MKGKRGKMTCNKEDRVTYNQKLRSQYMICILTTRPLILIETGCLDRKVSILM